MARIQRDYIVSIFNDLKGCCDRVRPAVNIVATRRMVLSKSVAVCHAASLRKMKHLIRTGFGISEEHLQWNEENDAGGLGQGNGGASVSCHSHMLPLETSYEAKTGQGVEYTNPGNTIHFFQWLVGFVDDNSIILKLENLGYTYAAETMLVAAKQYMEIWQRLVHITGGELQSDKSSYAVMAWKLKEGKEKLCKITNAPGEVSLRS